MKPKVLKLSDVELSSLGPSLGKPGRNRRFNVFITKLYPSGKIVFNILNRRRSREFKRHVSHLLSYLKAKGFMKVILIIDNATNHRSRETMRFLQKHKGNVESFFLPRYYPRLNEVEHINRALKRHVCSNMFYQEFGDLRTATRKYLLIRAEKVDLT